VKRDGDGKPEAYRYVLRQSRLPNLSTCYLADGTGFMASLRRSPSSVPTNNRITLALCYRDHFVRGF
jgi:hypothetical protein